jgi:EF-P beta-lysylation protein EpmB
LRQVLPLGEELLENEGFSHDPVGDLNALGGHGVINKYHGRSLLITTGACVIHCRYCFRRHFPYDAHNALRTDWREAIEALKAQPVEEVILSGGDPLALSNRRLAALLNVLTEIEGLKRIRIHSRYPIVLPERVDHGLLKILARCPKQCVMVVHSNHTQELGGEARQAIARLNDTDCRLYNQTVLLKGVNDRAETLIGLCETLFELGVQPYYLHQLDRVCGAAHFEVPKHEAALIYGRLMEQLPGYMVPKWVEEVAGATHKLPIHLINTV